MDKKKKNIIMIVAVSIIVITFFSISYAALTFRSTSFNQQLVLGDIWMKYDESNGFSIEDAVPGSDYSNYFEFTISGKNTYTKKDIYYDFILNRGDLPTNKTEENRIPDEYLKFKLVSVDDSNQETEIFKNHTYNDLTNKSIYVETIEKNTEDEVNRKYRLYMTIDYSLEIGNSETAVFTTEEWIQAFASVKLNVNGDFTIKKASNSLEFKTLTINKQSDNCKTYIEEDGIVYLSGNNDCIDFNYVWYSGKLWRITAIYPDGTMKMITEDNITTIAYGMDNNFYTDESTSSWIYQWLNEDFLDTLYNYENIIKIDSIWNVTSGNGIINTKLEEITMVSAKVGLLNSYEYYKGSENLVSYQDGYLYTGYGWWLSNPYDITNSSDIYHCAGHTGSGNRFGVRPVVNLKSTIQLVGGSGTKTNPYKIAGDKEIALANTTQLNTRSSGEYVKFDESLYRIIGIENGTTKINKVDYVRDERNIVLTKAFSSTIIFGKDTNTQSNEYWDYYLNNTWYDSITEEYKNMLDKGTYYLGTVNSSSGNYKLAICASASNTITTKDCTKTSTTYKGYVGLLRYGEMFSSQLSERNKSSNDMRLITPSGTTFVWYVRYNGVAASNKPSSISSSRPSINIKSEIVIKSGSGTKEDPFEIGLPN